MKAYRHLIRHALNQGATVSVYDGEEWACKKCNKLTQIIADIESVEEAQVIIRDASGEKIGWALIIEGLDDDETVADYTCTPFMKAWDQEYNQA
jgi:hypothetical protein